MGSYSGHVTCVILIQDPCRTERYNNILRSICMVPKYFITFTEIKIILLGQTGKKSISPLLLLGPALRVVMATNPPSKKLNLASASGY